MESTAVKFLMQVEQMRPSMLVYTVDQFVSCLSLLIFTLKQLQISTTN